METDRKTVPTPFQRHLCWAALSGLALVVLVGIILAFLYGLGALFVALQPVLLPVVAAGILAYLLSPLVGWVTRRLHSHVAAIILVMLGAGAVVAGIGCTVVPQVVEQGGQLLDNREKIFQSAVATAQEKLETNRLLQNAVNMAYNKALKDARAAELPQEDYAHMLEAPDYTGKLIATCSYYSDFFTEKAIDWVTAGKRAVGKLGLAVVGTIMVPVFLFYFLLEGEAIKRNWHRLIPMQRSLFRDELVKTLQEINDYIVSFVRGQMLVSVIDGALLAIALKVAGLPYAVTIGLCAAILGIIPYVGMICTWIPAVLIAWFSTHDTGMVVAVTIIFACVSQLDGWVIQPRVVGSRLKMHDMTVMFSVLFWSYVLGGVVGALLAVPITASIKVIFTRYIWKSLDRPQHGVPAAAPPSPQDTGKH